jgi:hypothetical protein
LKVYQNFKVGNVPILTQIVKDVTGNPLQANSNQLINKIQYYAGDYGIGDAATSLAWNNYADYFVDNFRGVVCRLAQDGITPISITNNTNAFFVATLAAYRQDLNNGVPETGAVYSGNPCIYGVFDANTNKYIIAMEEINRYLPASTTTTTSGPTTTSTTTTTTTTAAPTTTTTSTTTSTTSTTTTTTAASTNFLTSAGYAAPNECSGLVGPYPNSVYGNSSVWYDPGGPYVTRFFTDSGMTTPFNGGNLYYGDQYSTFGTTLQIDTDGYVIGYFSC